MERKENTSRLLLTVIGCLWLGLFPLLTGGTYATLTRDKWVIVQTLTAVTVLGGGAAIWQLRRISLREPVRLLALAYFLWLGVSAVWGSSADLRNAEGQLIVWIGAGRFEGMAAQLCYLAVFLALSLCRPRLRSVLYAAAAGLCVYAMIVAVQYANVNPFGLFPSGRSILLNYEFQGTIGNIDMVSGYVLLISAMLLAAWLLSPRRGGHFLLAVGLVGVLLELMMEVQGGFVTLGVLALLLLGAMLAQPTLRWRGMALLSGLALCVSLRQSIGLPWLDSVETLGVRFTSLGLASLLACGVLAALARYFCMYPGRAVRTTTVVCLLLAVCVGAMALVACLPVPDSMGGLYELHQMLHGQAQDSFGSWRIGVWRHALHMAAESPVFGSGPDTFYSLIRPHLAAEGAYLGENFDNPHNLYLAILVGSGIPALALYLGMLGVCIAQAVRRGDRGGMALAAGIVAYSVQGFFTFSICLVSPMFWAVLGMAAASGHRKEDPNGFEL